VNFTTAMPDANYACVSQVERNSFENLWFNKLNGGTQTSSGILLTVIDQTNSSKDPVQAWVAIFR